MAYQNHAQICAWNQLLKVGIMVFGQGNNTRGLG